MLHPDDVDDMHREAMALIGSSRSTGRIAAVAVRTGAVIEATGHAPLALDVYHRALETIYGIDLGRAEDYRDNGPVPPNPYYRRWGERIGEADAMEVAEPFERLLLRMGLRGYAHQRRRCHAYYERLFRNLYAAFL